MNKPFFCNYHLILNSSTAKNIDSLMNRITKALEVLEAPSTIQPYHKDLTKTEVFGYVNLPDIEFDNALMWLLKKFQFQFYSWNINGDFDNQISIQPEKFRESGIVFAEFMLSR